MNGGSSDNFTRNAMRVTFPFSSHCFDTPLEFLPALLSVEPDFRDEHGVFYFYKRGSGWLYGPADLDIWSFSSKVDVGGLVALWNSS